MFTIPANKFLRTVSEVIPFAGSARDIPELAAVRFEVTPAGLFTVATDRFGLLAGKIAPDRPIDTERLASLTGEFNIPTKQVKELCATLRGFKAHLKSSTVPLTIAPTYDSDGKRTFHAGWDFTVDGDVLLHHDLDETKFPTWRSLLRNLSGRRTDDPEYRMHTSLSCRILGGSRNLVLHARSENFHRPSLLRSSKPEDLDLIGLIMPIRNPDAGSPMSSAISQFCNTLPAPADDEAPASA